MFRIAREHAERAKAVSGKEVLQEAQEAMISILFSYTCLEAYINTVGIDHLGEDWRQFEDGKRRHSSTKTKWKDIPDILLEKKLGKGGRVFDDGEEPFKSFLELQKIRDGLVHLEQDFELPTETKYGNSDPVLNILTGEKAMWALEIVPAMVYKLDGLLIRPYPNWLAKEVKK